MDEIYMSEFWHFLGYFKELANEAKKSRGKPTDMSWLRDPKRKGK